MEQIRWIDFKQFIREDNLRIVKQYKISPRLLVGIFGDINDEKLLSRQTKNYLLVYGSPYNIKEFLWIAFIPGLNLLSLLYLFGWVLRYYRYLRIKCNVYDIEDNSNIYKLIRDANKELGLIQWEHCGKCRLCLKSEYSSINFINSDHVIVKKNNLFGVFNLRNRSWTFKCRYNSIRTDNSNNLIVTDNGIENIYTIYGERIVK